MKTVNRNFKIIGALLAAVLFVFLGLAFQASAALPGEGLTISPPILELTLKPGDVSNQTIRITNPTKSVVEVYPKIMDFTSKNEGGEPSFYESSSEDTPYSLSKWISFSVPKIAVAPEQVYEFKYTISVPQDADPGGHYGVVFFATEPPASPGETSQVSVSSMIGSLVLVKIPGQVTEKLVVEEFITDKNLYFNSPADILTRISNIGNVHVKPRGKIEVKGWYGSPKEPLNFNESGGNILPGGTRKFENKFNFSKTAFGYFTANLDLVYGDSEKPLTATVSFWIIPWWLIILIVVLIVLIVLLVVWLVRRKKKQKPKVKAPEAAPHSAPQPPAGSPPVLR